MPDPTDNLADAWAFLTTAAQLCQIAGFDLSNAQGENVQGLDPTINQVIDHGTALRNAAKIVNQHLAQVKAKATHSPEGDHNANLD